MMPTSWDYIQDVRFVLQEPPKSKRISRLLIRQLFPDIRPLSDETQTSERSHERVSIRHPRGRAPMLHLRLSEFDMSSVMRALRTPGRSPSSPRTHLIPETTPTGPTAEFSEGHLDVRYPHRRNAPFDVHASPITPNSPQRVTGPTPRASSSSRRTANPRSSAPSRDENLLPTHTREDTMSSTMSNLQVEVMTLSGSPPDPGFVLPIPSRSRSRQNPHLSLTNTQSMVCGPRTCATHPTSADSRRPSLQKLEYAEDAVIDSGYRQFDRATPPVNESDIALSSLDLPRPREHSWVSERLDASSAVISTTARLTRTNTIASVTSVAVRPTPATVPGDNIRTGQRLLGDPLSAVYVERSGGDRN